MYDHCICIIARPLGEKREAAMMKMKRRTMIFLASVFF
jgi:hypothetical protein